MDTPITAYFPPTAYRKQKQYSFLSTIHLLTSLPWNSYRRSTLNTVLKLKQKLVGTRTYIRGIPGPRDPGIPVGGK